MDNQLIEGCKKGKRKSFELLYKRYSPVLFGICYRYSKSRDEAEDILQDGFIRIYQKIGTFEGKGSFEGWMKRIMINTSINHYKSNLKHYFHDEVENHQLIDDGEINLNEMDSSLDRMQLVRLIQELPDGYKLVFNMYVIDGLTHNEIAEELNISVNTSKTQLFKARKKLREKLEKLINTDI